MYNLEEKGQMFFGENKKDAKQCTTCSLDVVSKQ